MVPKVRFELTRALRPPASKAGVSTIPPLRLVNVVRLSGLEPENLTEQALEACAFTISPQTHIWSDVTESNRYSWICSPEPNHSANAAYNLVPPEGIAPTRALRHKFYRLARLL